ncbi:STY1053 family phage-associated protein [Acinetobacter sp. A47]|uniref:STY1053 family phage-associated protein n=1 Tax=Acinetobacter sp. A47 TaxID=1561217 RepID=UPI000571CD3B|nr:hypothetical protein [Acinetobacter sp. A47]
MSKLVQILLNKELTVNLGRDEHGEAKTIVLKPGLQEVEKEVADNWFVKAHAQEIPENSAYASELEGLIQQKDQQIGTMQIQLEAAEKTINQQVADLQAKDKEISDLKILLAKAEQAPAATDAGTKGAAKAKEQPKEA